MEPDIREQFRALRKDNQILREEVRADIGGLHSKLDAHIAAINTRCAKHGEELAVVRNNELERDRRIDRRIALGLLLIAAVSLLMRFLP